MILRALNFIVIGALVLAAAYVYRIKFNSTLQAEHLAKLNTEVRHARDNIAALRAEWGELDNPERIQVLADRFLHLKPITPTQFDTLDRLPDRPPDDGRSGSGDPIAGIIENLEEPDTVTGSVPAAPTPSAAPTQSGADNAVLDPEGAPVAASPPANAAAAPAPSGDASQ